MTGDTTQQVALVTGASEGLGKHIAFEYARRGFAVMLCARREELLRENCAVIADSGGIAQYKVCDVRDPNQIKAVVKETLATYRRIDVAILNAGVGSRVVFSDLDIDEYLRIIDVNLNSVMRFFAALVPVMKAQGSGTIAGVSSLLDSRPIPGSSVYVASKAALSTLLESAAIELQPHNIQVVTVRPGFVATAMTAQNKLRMPMLMSVERAARIIVDGIIKGKKTISFPMPMAFLSSLMKVLPRWLWRRLFPQ
ncbi:MAG: SDR family NAD(P)-dependent oxidoreductase [bacterium]|nr:SDR family NAD(P)-dependent oxidoreductase [bacterium]